MIADDEHDAIDELRDLGETIAAELGVEVMDIATQDESTTFYFAIGPYPGVRYVIDNVFAGMVANERDVVANVIRSEISRLIEHNADCIIKQLRDPSVTRLLFPTPYTDLPAFIEGAREALRGDLTPEIAERFVEALRLATDMLNALDGNPAPLGAGRGSP